MAKLSNRLRNYFLKITNQTRMWALDHPQIITILVSLALIIIGSVVFYIRYPSAYNYSNFYAEDGKDFMYNLIEKGVIAGTLTAFNGYLVVGQYFVGIMAQTINHFFGNGFESLARSVAVASYIFWALICSLPWLLFRKRLGSILAVILVIMLWLTPFGSYDYAVIGTIGNLKFSFLFIATLLVIYRNDRSLCNKTWQFILVDIALLVCVLTNIVVLALLPLLLIPYVKKIRETRLGRSFLSKVIKMRGMIGLVVLAIISFIYLLTVYAHEVPVLVGYLDGPLDKSALIAIAYRASFYVLFFPVHYLITNAFGAVALVSLIVILLVASLKLIKKNIGVVGILVYAMIINIAGFVANRPGVTEYFNTYDARNWPGLFFYPGTMLLLFGIVYLISKIFNTYNLRSKLTVLGLLICSVFIILPATGFNFADRYGVSRFRPVLSDEVSRVCAIDNTSNVTIGLYPSGEWTVSLPRSEVCN